MSKRKTRFDGSSNAQNPGLDSDEANNSIDLAMIPG